MELRDALDRTATGKLQKYKLRQPYWEGRDEARQLRPVGEVGEPAGRSAPP